MFNYDVTSGKNTQCKSKIYYTNDIHRILSKTCVKIHYLWVRGSGRKRVQFGHIVKMNITYKMFVYSSMVVENKLNAGL